MKKIIALILTLVLLFGMVPFAAESSDNITGSFTDPNFLAAVRLIIGKSEPEPILRSDVVNITSLDVNTRNISNLAGIENFTALRDLNVRRNRLTSLDVSSNPVLTSLLAEQNELTSLNVSSNPALATLYVNENQLTSINISDNPVLRWLLVHNNRLTSLDMGNNLELRWIFASNNQLTSLDVRDSPALTALNVNNNQLMSLDVSNNPALTGLNVAVNQLTTLDVSNNPVLTELNVGGNRLTSLDVSRSPALETLDVWNNQLTTLDVSNNPVLTRLYVGRNQLTSLILSPIAPYWDIDVRYNGKADKSTITGRDDIDWDVLWSSNRIPFRFSPQFTISDPFIISASPRTPAFGSQQFGYTQIPAQTITISNTGSDTITLDALPNVPNWTLVQAANWSIPLVAGEIRTFSIRPNNSLNAGTYNPVITISGNNGVVKTQIQPMFTVTLPPIESFITRLYQNVLGRPVDPSGLADWSNALRGGALGSDAAFGFFFSQELTNRNVTNEAFVDLLYLTLLDRPADAAGRAAWVDWLNQGLPREDVFAGFVNSVEFDLLCSRAGIVRGTYTPPAGGMARIFAARLFSVTLQRAPDVAGLNDWHAALVAGASGTQVARGFMFSSEMNARGLNNADFVEILYNAKMGRASDPAGKAAWVNLLNNGISREAVFLGFANSVEFEHICWTHGIQR